MVAGKPRRENVRSAATFGRRCLQPTEEYARTLVVKHFFIMILVSDTVSALKSWEHVRVLFGPIHMTTVDV